MFEDINNTAATVTQWQIPNPRRWGSYPRGSGFSTGLPTSSTWWPSRVAAFTSARWQDVSACSFFMLQSSDRVIYISSLQFSRGAYTRRSKTGELLVVGRRAGLGVNACGKRWMRCVPSNKFLVCKMRATRQPSKTTFVVPVLENASKILLRGRPPCQLPPHAVNGFRRSSPTLVCSEGREKRAALSTSQARPTLSLSTRKRENTETPQHVLQDRGVNYI